MKRNYRSVLPAPDGTRQAISPCIHAPAKSKRRQVARVACNACRKRKGACNSQRPVCGECIKRGSECVYITTNPEDTPSEALKRQIQSLEEKLRDHVEMIDHLRSLSEQKALELMRQLNNVSDLSVLVASIKGGSHGQKRPSILAAARSVSPLTHTGLEFELMAMHKVAYPALVPIDIASITLSPIVQSSIQRTHYLDGRSSTIEVSTADHNILSSIECGPQHGSISTPQRETSPFRRVGRHRASPLPGPSRPDRYIDKRLQDLHVSYWTRVPINDELAASVLSLYFELDHPVLGFFDADLFLSDLVDHRLRFCSSFLYSSLMHYACQSYTAVDIRASALSHAFYIEAEMLWHAERLTDSLTTVAAVQIFSFGCVARGKDRLGLELLREGRLMAERLKLFGIPHSESTKACFTGMPPEWNKAAAHTAWGFYNWLSLHSFYYHDKAILFPPCFPIPGKPEDNITLAEGQWPSHILPTYMGQTFTALCEFWTIIQEIIVVFHAPQGTINKDHVPLAFIESKYQKLLHWIDRSVGIAQENGKPDHVIFFHIIFHQIILLIFRPFFKQSETTRLNSFSSSDSTVEAVFKASLNQLKRLILLSRLEYPRMLRSMFLSGAPMHISSAMLSEAGAADPEWRSWLMLCMQTYQDLYVCYPVHLDVVQGFMAMALKSGAISSSEAREVVERTKARGRHHKTAETIGLFTIDFHLALTDPEDAKAHNLSLKLGELALFNEITGGEYNSSTVES